MLLILAKVVTYLIATFAVFGVVAPMLISARSYEAVGAGSIVILTWLFITAYLIEKLTKKKETKE